MGRQQRGDQRTDPRLKRTTLRNAAAVVIDERLNDSYAHRGTDPNSLSEIALQRLAHDPIAAVSAVVARRIVPLVTQMLSHPGLHRTFHYRLCDLLQKRMHVFRLPSFGQP